MGIWAWIVVGVALGIATPFMIIQLQRRRDLVRAGPVPAAARREVARPANPFAAVSIQPCIEGSCAAVVAMAGIRYLAVRAPRLPVPGCDHKQCGCRYVRHADRRSPGDRRDAFARFGGLVPKSGRDLRARDDRRRG